MSGLRHPSESASLIQVFENIMEDRLALLNVSMPAKVTSIDSLTGLLSVQPCFKRQYIDQVNPVNLPIIEGVPLAEIRAGDAIISVPIAEGDFVTLWFSQRSLEKWKTDGRTDITGDSRKHHISDAIAYPGGYPISKNIKTDRTALIMQYGGSKVSLKKDESVDIECVTSKINMTKDGKIKIGNGSVDLLDLLNTFLDEFTKATYPTALGPTGTVVNPLPFQAIIQKLATILG